MNDHSLNNLLEEIASSIVMLEISDKPALGQALILFEELEKSLSETKKDDGLQDSVKRCISIITSIILEETKDVDKDINTISEIVSNLQKVICDNQSIKPLTKPEKTVADFPKICSGLVEGKECEQNSQQLSGNEFKLPDWVEETIFNEFITNQSVVLEEIETDILSIEKRKSEGVSSLRRRIHTMKGEAGVLGLNGLVEVCHALEDCLDSNAECVNQVDLLLEVKDWISGALNAYSRFQMPQLSPEEIVARLNSIPPKTPSTKQESSSLIQKQIEEQKSSPETCIDESLKTLSGIKVQRDEETISLIGDFLQESEEGISQVDQILMNVENDGLNPEMINEIFRVFHTIKGVAGFLNLNEVKSLSHKTETMLNNIRQGTLVLGGPILDLLFDITDTMREMFDTVRQAVESSQEIESIQSLPSLLTKIQDITEGKQTSLPQEPLPSIQPGVKLGEVLEQITSVTKEEIESALEMQRDSGKRLGEELVSSNVVKPRDIVQALRLQKSFSGGQTFAQVKEVVKVDADRLDRLVETIGELVIAESMVKQSIELNDRASTQLARQLNHLDKITRELQEMGTSLRMVPVRATFQKMARLVRDLAKKEGKQVEFMMTGEDTELDKSVVDKIGDPLMHMVRNAVDHGLEGKSEERIKAGKPPVGRIELCAFHKGGSIHIEVKDDGRGLNRNAILAKARERNLIRDGEVLSEREIFNLIFLPGFSTAKKVTEVSGRGVGMDVVKRNIEALRGQVEIQSEEGKGATFSIRLPLTLAIIDGMVIRIGYEKYIIPTLSVIRAIRPEHRDISTIINKGEMLSLQGKLIPLFRLGKIFNITVAEQDLTKALAVIVEDDGRQAGLIVDDLLGQQQIVIKNLGEAIQGMPGISGGAIMADGRVGLILDVGGLVKLAHSECVQESSNAEEQLSIISER